MKPRMAVGVLAIVVVGGLLIGPAVISRGRNGDGAHWDGGVVGGAVVAMMEEGEGYVSWIIKESDGASSIWGRERVEVLAEIPLLDVGVDGRGVSERGELRWVKVKINAGEDAMAVGVTRKGDNTGLEVVRFGDVTPRSMTAEQDVSIWRSVQGEEASELVLRVEGCDEGELEVFQRFGGDVARQWRGRRPEDLEEWAVADDFWVEVRYLFGYEQVAIRSDDQGALGNRIEFGFDDAAIKEGEEGKLREVARFLRDKARIGVIIEGHADDHGGREYNEELGLTRARAVQRFLVDEGIERTRLALVSCGKRMPLPLVPIVPSTQSEAHARNRRVEFKIAMPRVLSSTEGVQVR